MASRALQQKQFGQGKLSTGAAWKSHCYEHIAGVEKRGEELKVYTM